MVPLFKAREAVRLEAARAVVRAGALSKGSPLAADVQNMALAIDLLCDVIQQLEMGARP